MAKFNKEINDKMEAAAREAFLELENELNSMPEAVRLGAEKVISYFKDNYMQAGYKKLARKLVKDDIDA